MHYQVPEIHKYENFLMLFNKQKFKYIEEEIRLLRAQSSISLFEQKIINSRKDFGYILNYLGLSGAGVEVGVRKGNFSKYLLDTWKGQLLYSVDPWLHYSDGEYIDGSNVGQKKQEKIYQEARKKLSRYKQRSVIIRATSLDAAKQITDRSLDFVYLDAQHHYEAVKQDIAIWRSKLRSGGVISGDDYADIKDEDNVFGVKKAVDEFVSEQNIELILTADGLFPSWFAICD